MIETLHTATPGLVFQFSIFLGQWSFVVSLYITELIFPCTVYTYFQPSSDTDILKYSIKIWYTLTRTSMLLMLVLCYAENDFSHCYFEQQNMGYSQYMICAPEKK